MADGTSLTACYLHTPVVFYFVSITITIGLIGYLARFSSRSNTVTWFKMVLGLSLLYNVVAAAVKCPVNPLQYSLSIDIYGFAAATIPAAVFIFVVHFMNKGHWLSYNWVRSALAASTFIVIYLYWGGDLFISHDFADAIKSYGFYSQPSGPLSPLFALIGLPAFVAPFFLLIHYLRGLEDPVKRHEARLITWGIGAMIIPPVFIEGVFPDITHVPAPPISPLTTAIAAGLIVYALTKYGARIFNLTDIASDIMQVMPGGLIVLDHANTIQYTNTGAAAMLGYKTSELTGASVKKLFPNVTAYGSFQMSVLGRLTPGRSVTGQEVELSTKRKQPLPVSLNATSVYTGLQVTNRLLSFADITSLKQVEAELQAEKKNVERKIVQRTRELTEAQAQLTASVRSLPFGFAVIDTDDQIVFSNELFGRLLNHSIPSEPKASRAALKAIIDNFHPAINISSCLVTSRTKQTTIERNITLGPRFYRFYFMPVTHTVRGKVVVLGTVLLVEDTTEAKTLERSRDEFFSIASHELRTPLTAIRGNTELMLDYYKSAFKDPDLRGMVEDVHGASLRLITIVNDFLDMSRLEMGKIVFENQPVNLTELVQETLREYDVTSSRRKLKLQLMPVEGPDPWVEADPNRLRQILINLIGNALKATDQGGITIALKRQNDTVKISVTDTGKGIPEDAQHLLFRKFQQTADSILTRDNTQSTGLGLYISRMLAAGMRGRLTLEHTKVGEGSTFALELPRIAAPKA